MGSEAATDKAEEPVPKKKGLDLSTKILLGLFVGAACGLFFGEYVAWLKGFGTAFVGLLQMTVLPYLMVALIANLGRLDLASSKQLLLKGSLVLLVLWGLGCLAIALTPFALPIVETGSFFSSTDPAEGKTLDLLQLFVPFNVFESLSANLVPGVVVFCIFLGLALMTLPGKEKFIDLLDVMGAALLRVNSMVVKLMPIGTFAIAGGAAATMSLDEFERLEGYILVSLAAVAILTFWVLPMLIAAVTPFGYRQIMKMTRTALITAFATSKVIVVFPLLIDETNRLFRELGASREDTEPRVEVLYPLAYPFPHLGKLMGLLFLPFAAWFAGTPIEAGQMPALLGGGLLSYFGGPILATPFLLDLMQLPADLFHLFLASGFITARLGDLLGVMHFVAMAIITTCWVTGLLRINVRALLRMVIGGVALTLLAIFLIRARLTAAAAGAEDRSQILASMQAMKVTAKRTILEEAAPNPVPLAPGMSAMERVRKTRVLRVGYNDGRLPFSYFNGKGELVGFDVELMDHLADDMELSLVFVPYELDALADQLAADHFDLAVGGIVTTPLRLETTRVSAPYLDAHVAVVVRDHVRDDYTDIRAIRKLEGVRVGYSDPMYERGIRLNVPEATLVRLQSPDDFFEERGEGKTLDAFAGSAEAGFAWTLMHPDFHVAFPFGYKATRPFAFPIRSDDDALKEFLDGWIDLARRDQTIRRLYDYWVLGKSATPKKPRWCVIRDVLHWVD